jgi:hypothetical protein
MKAVALLSLSLSVSHREEDCSLSHQSHTAHQRQSFRIHAQPTSKKATHTFFSHASDPPTNHVLQIHSAAMAAAHAVSTWPVSPADDNRVPAPRPTAITAPSPIRPPFIPIPLREGIFHNPHPHGCSRGMLTPPRAPLLKRQRRRPTPQEASASTHPGMSLMAAPGYPAPRASYPGPVSSP